MCQNYKISCLLRHTKILADFKDYDSLHSRYTTEYVSVGRCKHPCSYTKARSKCIVCYIIARTKLRIISSIGLQTHNGLQSLTRLCLKTSLTIHLSCTIPVNLFIAEESSPYEYLGTFGNVISIGCEPECLSGA